MNLGPVLEVAVAVVFIYVVLSLICLGVTELLSQLLRLRSRFLGRGIKELLRNPKLDVLTRVIGQFMPRKPGGKEREPSPDAGELLKDLPDSIPSRTFANALLQAITKWEGDIETGKSLAREFKTKLAAITKESGNQHLLALQTMLAEVEDDVAELRGKIEAWFDDSMETVTQWYKRHTQKITIAVALIVAVGLNADTFTIAGTLWKDANMRAAIVAVAETAAEKPAPFDTTAAATVGDSVEQDTSPKVRTTERSLELIEEAAALELPLGWSARFRPTTPAGWLAKIAGWLFTACAISLGAPFWFDLLRRLVGIRAATRKKKGLFALLCG